MAALSSLRVVPMFLDGDPPPFPSRHCDGSGFFLRLALSFYWLSALARLYFAGISKLADGRSNKSDASSTNTLAIADRNCFRGDW